MVSKRVLFVLLVLLSIYFCPGLRAEDPPAEDLLAPDTSTTEEALPAPMDSEDPHANPSEPADLNSPSDGTLEEPLPFPDQEQAPVEVPPTEEPQSNLAPTVDEALSQQQKASEDLMLPYANTDSDSNYYSQEASVKHATEKKDDLKRPWFSIMLETSRRGSKALAVTDGVEGAETEDGDKSLALGIDARIWGTESNFLSFHLNGFLSFLNVAFSRLGATIEIEPFRRVLLVGGVHSFVMSPPLGVEYDFSKVANLGAGFQFDFYVAPKASVGLRFYRVGKKFSYLGFVFSMDPIRGAKAASQTYRYQR